MTSGGFSQDSSKRVTRQLSVGGAGRAPKVLIGGGAPVSVQSMCNTDTRDIQASLAQIGRLHEAGCEIIRLAVPDMAAADALSAICAESPMPVVADIHFDYRLALAALKAGVAKIRINPGNIGAPERVKAVADACRERGVPIRIGVNSGSVAREKLERLTLIDAMVESALEQLQQLEDFGFTQVCLSVKASDVRGTLEAYQRLAGRTDVPLHLGVTETGTSYHGIIKSAIGIGALLCDGLGDTIRVSLTADPVEEVRAGLAILKACGLRKTGLELISCPTCGRTRIGVEALAHQVEEELRGLTKPITVAVMGCAVNGPGEARAADVGIAGGDGKGVIFRKGEIVESVPEEQLLERLLAHVREIENQ